MIPATFPDFDRGFYHQVKKDLKHIQNSPISYSVKNGTFVLTIQKISQDHFKVSLDSNEYKPELKKDLKSKIFKIIEKRHGFVLKKEFNENVKCAVNIQGDFTC